MQQYCFQDQHCSTHSYLSIGWSLGCDLLVFGQRYALLSQLLVVPRGACIRTAGGGSAYCRAAAASQPSGQCETHLRLDWWGGILLILSLLHREKGLKRLVLLGYRQPVLGNG
jgi:hypothetical protein